MWPAGLPLGAFGGSGARPCPRMMIVGFAGPPENCTEEIAGTTSIAAAPPNRPSVSVVCAAVTLPERAAF